MILDLASRPNQTTTVDTGILIVGGGIAGLLLAQKLRERRLPVVILESGGREQADPTHPLNEVEQLGDTYRGATEGRARCLGGTSTRWGGALIPFLPQDFEARAHVDVPAWPVRFDDLAPFVTELEALFGLDTGASDERFLDGRPLNRVPAGDADFIARFAKWPVFKKRNLAHVFKDRLARDPDLSIWLNATVAAFTYDEAGRLAAIEARHISGKSLTVRAHTVVLCAGAIETTRLLLLLDRQTDGRAFRSCDALGRYFHDHVSAHAANIASPDPLALNRLAGFRFAGSTMRSLRFEMSPAAQALDRVGSAFGHISFQASGETSFDALRDLMRGLQRTGTFDHNAALRVIRDLPYLAKAAYWRYAKHQLRWPIPARYELHIVAEQMPQSSNRITLSSRTDALGVPSAAIDWRIGAKEFATIAAYASRFNAYWSRHGLDAAGKLEWMPAITGGATHDLARVGDVFHPGGTTRLGSDGTSAVVDRNLKTFAIPNVWVASTSVFPSGASANPTMTLMLFTLRLADRLAAAAGRSQHVAG